MSSSPPSTTLSLPTTTTAPMATTTGAPPMPVPATSAAPLPVALTPEEIAGAIRDLTTAVQGIRLFLAGPYGPPPAAPAAAANGPALLPWQPPHQAAPAAIAGPWQPTLLLSSPPLDARLLQPPLPLSTISGPGPTSASGIPLSPAPVFPLAVAVTGLGDRDVTAGLYGGLGAAAHPVATGATPAVRRALPLRRSLRRPRRCAVPRGVLHGHRTGADPRTAAAAALGRDHGAGHHVPVWDALRRDCDDLVPSSAAAVPGRSHPADQVPAVAVTASGLDRYPPRVGGGEAAGCCARPPSASAYAGDA